MVKHEVLDNPICSIENDLGEICVYKDENIDKTFDLYAFIADLLIRNQKKQMH